MGHVLISFEELYTLKHDELLHQSYRYTHNWHRSEDIVQDAFLGILRVWNDDASQWDISRMSGWLVNAMKIVEGATNVSDSMTHIRTEWDDSERRVAGEESWGTVNLDALPVDLYQGPAEPVVIDRALALFMEQLTTEDQEILEHMLAGAKAHQVAQLLGITIATVDYRYRRLIIEMKRHTGVLPPVTKQKPFAMRRNLS